MNRAACFALLAALGAGCTVTVEQAGPPMPLEGLQLPVNGARAESIVERLGVPDEVGATEQGFSFVYRFVRRNEHRFVIGSYGLKLVADDRVLHREGTLDLWFDAAGRLLASRLREGAQEAGG
jgi:hypothetical protein